MTMKKVGGIMAVLVLAALLFTGVAVAEDSDSSSKINENANVPTLDISNSDVFDLPIISIENEIEVEQGNFIALNVEAPEAESIHLYIVGQNNMIYISNTAFKYSVNTKYSTGGEKMYLYDKFAVAEGKTETVANVLENNQWLKYLIIDNDDYTYTVYVNTKDLDLGEYYVIAQRPMVDSIFNTKAEIVGDYYNSAKYLDSLVTAMKNAGSEEAQFNVLANMPYYMGKDAVAKINGEIPSTSNDGFFAYAKKILIELNINPFEEVGGSVVFVKGITIDETLQNAIKLIAKTYYSDGEEVADVDSVSELDNYMKKYASQVSYGYTDGFNIVTNNEFMYNVPYYENSKTAEAIMNAIEMGNDRYACSTFRNVAILGDDPTITVPANETKASTPFPMLGILAGIGAATVILKRRH